MIISVCHSSLLLTLSFCLCIYVVVVGWIATFCPAATSGNPNVILRYGQVASKKMIFHSDLTNHDYRTSQKNSAQNQHQTLDFILDAKS